MSDDLDDLKDLMQAATPQADPARKAENLVLAQKNFDDLQGSKDKRRLSSVRSDKGLFRGVIHMFANFPLRGALVSSTAIVAVAMIAVFPQFSGDSVSNGPLGGLTSFSGNSSQETQVELSGAAKQAILGQGSDSPDIHTDLDVEFEPGLAETVVVEEAAEISLDAVEMRARPSAQPVARSAPRGLAPALTAEPAIIAPEINTETFANADDNPLKVTAEDPVSTFSIDVDTASYAVVRNSLMAGRLPPVEAVRIEEMINYFPYDYAAPQTGQAFRPTVSVTNTPWNEGTQLVHIALQGAQVTERPPLNLVFLIDTSGSMNQANKLPLLKQSFRLMLGQLRPEDEVSIVTYAGSAGRVLDPTPARERAKILAALEALDAGGSTAGQAGLQQAYATATEMAEDGQVSRVILATDGDFNVGLSDPEALKDYIADKRDSGTYLSVLGFGRGNLDDATMQALAQNGNGTASYIDTLSEAQKVLVDQLSGALFPIADDVKIQVEWNPAAVAEYRLIGYETRALKREDFNNDKVDAGDIGAGHQVTAIYEVTPVGSDARLTDPLRYGAATEGRDPSELGFLRLRHKTPGVEESQLIETPILADMDEISQDARFGIAIAGFGQILRGSDLMGDWSIDDAIGLATDTRGTDPFGYRQEAIGLMRLASSLTD